MYFLFFVLPFLLMIPLIIYFYFYFKRIIIFICKEIKYKLDQNLKICYYYKTNTTKGG